MADEPSHPAPIGEIEHGPSKFEQFLDKNQKKLVLGIILLILAISAGIVIQGVKEAEDHSAGEALSAAGDSGGTYDLAALRDVMESFTGSPASGSAAILLAEEQWKDNRRDEAVATLTAFIDANPEHRARPTALMALGLHLLEQEKTEDGVAKLQEVVDSPAGRHLAPFALLTLGDLKKRAGDNDAAKALYEQANQNYPENTPSMIQFVNQRIALLGVEPPVKIAPPPVPEPPVNPNPPTPMPGGNSLFPELENPTPIPGIPSEGIPGMPSIQDNLIPPVPTLPVDPEAPATIPPPSAPETPAGEPDPAAPDSTTPADHTPADTATPEPEPDPESPDSETATEGSTPAGEDPSASDPATPASETTQTP